MDRTCQGVPPAATTREVLWEAQLARLAAYKVAHGDCNVPQGCRGDNPRLAGWISNQRQYKRRLDRGEPSKGMTAERAARLTALGLVWDPPKLCAARLQSSFRILVTWALSAKIQRWNCSKPRLMRAFRLVRRV
jgi:hypothetical protein